MNKDEALQAINQLETLVKRFGGPNEQDHETFKRLIFGLRIGPMQDYYFREKLSVAEGWAGDGFSTRKFNKYVGGLQQVQVGALGALSTARSLVQDRWPDK